MFYFKMIVMLFKDANIMSDDWLELVFDGRNKLYGAYVLRKQANADMTRALFMGMALFVAGIVAPVLWDYLKPDAITTRPDRDLTTVVDLMAPMPKEEKIVMPSPPAASAAKARTDQVRMPRPKVVQAHLAMDEVPTIDELKKANPGPRTIAGDPDAAIAIDVAVSESGKGQGITEGFIDEGNGIAEYVEVMPAFPGGMGAFLEYVARHYRIPANMHDGLQGRVIIKFVVERDGSLTGFEIMKALGEGTGEEAIRVLRSAPRWKPGIQNGRPVRVSYTLPIQLRMQ